MNKKNTGRVKNFSIFEILLTITILISVSSIFLTNTFYKKSKIENSLKSYFYEIENYVLNTDNRIFIFISKDCNSIKFSEANSCFPPFKIASNFAYLNGNALNDNDILVCDKILIGCKPQKLTIETKSKIINIDICCLNQRLIPETDISDIYYSEQVS